ncbi:lipopolysaccharide biosynthesis protein [Pontibacter ramchanderi]|uniref:O-antigen/teichoic acid export membrane protein n=1 Tax=Pontibacter ramchanderi TaxID=1179743 RepID=A0A2N3UB54_9BACT|nr:lipopolysaccharide biosynthesis protein [Pontibacter ramchanderi]PKV66614.1 O-antigen/teichoic acid export membrane protein [Pontibacter ramchanderi]
MLRKLLSHAAIYGLSAQIPRLAGVLALPLITQHLTPEDYGVAGVVTAYYSALVMLQSLGFTVVMENSFARHPRRFQWIWRQLYGFLTSWSLVYGLLCMGIIYLAVPADAHENRLLISLLVCTPTLFFVVTDLFGGFYCLHTQRPVPIAVRSFLMGGTNVLLTIYFIAELKLGYMGWFYASTISAAVGTVVSVYVVATWKLWPIFNFKWYRIRQSLRVSLPAVPHGFSFFMLDTSDRLVLDVLGIPVGRIGLYNVASNFGMYFSSASLAVVQAASPLYMKLYAQTKSMEAALQARRMTFVLQILFFAGTFVASLWMKEIFDLLIRNKELQQAYPLAIIILMGYNFRPMFMAVTNLLTFHEKTNQLWRISTVAGIGNILLNLILIPLYGFQMAAYTTFAALIYMGYAGFLLRSYQELTLVRYYAIWWLLATVTLLVVAYQLREVSVWQKTLISLVSLSAGIAAFWKNRKPA